MRSPAYAMSVSGPLRTVAVGSFCRESTGRVACRVPARRPGNFHLRGQIKVTKAKALNATPLMRSARAGGPARRATWRPCSTADLPRARRRGPRKASPALTRWTQGRRAARPRRVSCRLDPPRGLQVARRAGVAQREERAVWCCIEPLCFGDFHLGPQMKVTWPPGRDPAGNADHQEPPKQDKTNARKGPKADNDRVCVSCAAGVAKRRSARR